MAVEIEAKMKVGSLEPIRAALQSLGAERLGLTFERNVFFDAPDKALLKRDEGLRLRTNRDVERHTQTHVITHKGPQQPGAFKSREETEVTVDDPAATEALFAKLGYQKQLAFEKRRETWKLSDCKVELDELPHLGTFVEVEGPGEGAVSNVRAALGLADVPTIKTSYIGMLVEYLRNKGSAAGEVKFGDA